MVIADNLAPLVDAAFTNPTASTALAGAARSVSPFRLTALLRLLDLAIGIAKLLGFRSIGICAHLFLANVAFLAALAHLAVNVVQGLCPISPLGGSLVSRAQRFTFWYFLL